MLHQSLSSSFVLPFLGKPFVAIKLLPFALPCDKCLLTGYKAAESLLIVLFSFPITFRVEKGHFHRFPHNLIFTINTAFIGLCLEDSTRKIPTVNIKFPRLNSTFPHRIPVASKQLTVTVTVKSHLLASAVCANFPKFVSNSSIIAGCRNGLRSKP